MIQRPDAGHRGAQAAFLPTFPRGTPPELADAIENGARNAFEQHGASAFISTRYAAITHEVGHAIVGTHEEIKIREIAIYSQSMPLLGETWGGHCYEAGSWTSGPDTTADHDLRRARFTIAGLAGEAITGMDKPGSSLDELALSQLIGLNAAAKLADPKLPDADYDAYAEHLWHEKVWHAAIAIIRGNREPFMKLAELLNQHEVVNSGKIRRALAQVRKVVP
jgi:hypothetical protein